MKSLTEYINEGHVTKYKVTDIDIDKFKEIAEKLGNDKDGLGAGVAKTKEELVSTILGKMFNKQSWNVELQFKTWNTRKPVGPVYPDEIEQILNDNFNVFETDEITYLAPKKTPKATVKRWLNDDGHGLQGHV